MAQGVKDLALSLQQWRFDHWLRKLHMLQVWPKKKKKKDFRKVESGYFISLKAWPPELHRFTSVELNPHSVSQSQSSYQPKFKRKRNRSHLSKE